MPQLVGQVESTSTRVKPLPAICISNAFLMAFLAFMMCLHVVHGHPRDVGRAVQGGQHFAHADGIAVTWRDRGRRGEVVVTWPGRVVGAIWPPVMP